MVASPVLQCFEISVRFGGVRALNAVSFLVPGGSIVGIVGSNGSGKSTLLNCIGGLQPVTSGCIELNGRNITHLPAWKVAKMGVARAFQAPRLPDSLPVGIAVAYMLGADVSHQVTTDLWSPFERYGLRDRNILCSDLPFGDKKMAASLMALLSRAHLVLLDEPLAGLDSDRVASIVEAIQRFRSDDRATILVEHSIGRLLTIADTIIVLDEGRLVAIGAAGAAEVQSSLTALNLA